MVDQLFPKGRQAFLDGSADYDTATIKVSLVRGYTYVSTHTFVSDVTATGVLVATATLATKTVVDGVADADDVTFANVPTGTACSCLIVYQASAVTGGADVAATAQRLIAFIDAASGLPVTPNGGNIACAWSAGANRIFAL